MYQLQIEVSEEVYEKLLRLADRLGETPESLVAKWIADAVRSLDDEPLDEYFGSFDSGMPDVADQHDSYLGLSYLDTHDPDKEK